MARGSRGRREERRGPRPRRGRPSLALGRRDRSSGRDEDLQLISTPQVVEVVDPSAAPDACGWQTGRELEFAVEADRLRALEATTSKALDGRLRPYALGRPIDRLAAAAATAFSGIALWPALVLDDARDIVVRARGPSGEHQRSHWQTLLAMAAPSPSRVRPGAAIRTRLDFLVTKNLDQAARYELHSWWN